MIGEMQMIRVLVVDDMQPICRRYEKLINQEEDMEVVGLAFSGAEALEMVRTLEPNVVLMDIEMETIQAGIDAAAAIHPQKPEAKIIYLTAHDNDDMILTAMATGAVDYFVKGSQDEWLFEHIRMAYAGNPTMSEHTQRVMLREYSRLRRNETSLLYFVNTLSLLTPTERELVRYLLQGLNARQISEVRVVGQDTVKTQIHSIREKFGCSRTKEIVLRIRELGLEYLFR